mgnify:CR=1 FL=1
MLFRSSGSQMAKLGARRKSTPLIAMLDIDKFKSVNDTYGHDVGDSVLRMVGAKMRKSSGGGKPFRYGGEEFTLVFQGKSSDQVRGYLDELRETIAGSKFMIRNLNRRRNDSKRGKGRKPRQKMERITVSIGVADNNGNYDNPWDVMKAADKALYKAKKGGRNCVKS